MIHNNRAKKLFAAVAAACSLFLQACRQSAPRTPEELGRGAYFSFNCNRCHRIGHMGNTDAPDLTFVGFRHTKEWLDLWMRDSKSWKKDTVMPDFHLEPVTRENLVAYMASLKGQGLEGERPWNEAKLLKDPVKRGAVLYERLGCAACHGRNGQGGYPNNNVAGGKIPAVIYAADGYSREELANLIRKGRRPEKEKPDGLEPMITMPAWGDILSDDEIGALAGYLYSLRPPMSKEDQW